MTDDQDRDPTPDAPKSVTPDSPAPPVQPPVQPIDPIDEPMVEAAVEDLPVDEVAASTTQPTTDDHITPPPAPAESSRPAPVITEDKGTPVSPLVVGLVSATGILLILTILFGLMAFFPRVAPIKSSATRLAARAQEDEEIEAIARRFARNFVTLDHETLDEDLDRMVADATGNFREQLQRTIEAIGEDFKKSKASSSGRALDAAVLSHEEDSALVQVLLRRTKRNVGTKGPETGNQIVNVALVKTSDGWKVDNLTQLGAEGE